MMRAVPSEDTLQRVLPLLLERVEPEGGAQCFLVCKSWRWEMEARGFCNKTVQLCWNLAEGGQVARLWEYAQRRRDASTGGLERSLCEDVCGFLQRTWGRDCSLAEWLQAASQEPDASFLARGAALTAQCLGMTLLQWVGKPQGKYPRLHTMGRHSRWMWSIAFSPDGKRIVSGSVDKLVRIWNAETGAEVSIVQSLH